MGPVAEAKEAKLSPYLACCGGAKGGELPPPLVSFAQEAQGEANPPPLVSFAQEAQGEANPREANPPLSLRCIAHASLASLAKGGGGFTGGLSLANNN